MGRQKEATILNMQSRSTLLTRRHVSEGLEEVMKESIKMFLGSTSKAEEITNFKSIRLEHVFYVNEYSKEAHVVINEYMGK